MTRFMTTELTCPNCGAQFTTQTIASTNSLGGYTTEFRPIPFGAHPEPGFVHTCPRCGLSGMSDLFEEAVDPLVSALIAEHLTPLLGAEPLTAARRYELAAKVAQMRGVPAIESASCFLRAAWCAEDGDGPRDSAQRFRRQAIHGFEWALSVGELDGANELEIRFLVGELRRRVGDIDAATARFDEVIAGAGDDQDSRALAELAQRQKTTPQNTI